MNIGKALVELRESKNIRQADAANGIGVSQSFLSLLETGKKEPIQPTIRKIAEYYKVHELYIYVLAIEKTDIRTQGLKPWKTLRPKILEVLNKQT